MLTINSFLTDYCKEKNLAKPTAESLSQFGRIISKKFRQWAMEMPDDVIAEARFVRVEENGQKMIIIVYPTAFRMQMRIEAFNYFVAPAAVRETITARK